jgi:hypothetical protein
MRPAIVLLGRTRLVDLLGAAQKLSCTMSALAVPLVSAGSSLTPMASIIEIVAFLFRLIHASVYQARKET